MHEPYKIEDIIATVKNSYLALCSSLALALYKNRFREEIYKNLSDIILSEKGSSYIISKEAQLYSLNSISFENFVISSALRSVFSGMYEGLKENEYFKNKIKIKLSNQYDDFYALVNLLRNLYSHEITWSDHNAIILKNADFRKFKLYRQKKNLPEKISIKIFYKDILPAEIKSPYNYYVEIHLDTNLLNEGTNLSSIFNQRSQIMLAELCYNLCMVAF